MILMTVFSSLEKGGTIFIFLPGTSGPGCTGRSVGCGEGSLDGTDKHGMKDRASKE